MSWVDADTLIVSRDWGAGTLTKSTYPFVVKLLRRGQSLAQAQEVYRGTPDDIGAGIGHESEKFAGSHTEVDPRHAEVGDALEDPAAVGQHEAFVVRRGQGAGPGVEDLHGCCAVVDL